MNNNNWAQMMQNPKATMLKKLIVQVLGNKTVTYEDLITRLGATLVTDNDFKIFAELINDVLQAGYFRAIDDYRDQLGKMDISATLSLPRQKN